MPINVTIVGTGYVGLVTGACLAELGHRVTCLDADRNKVALLEGGGMPIYEPGLEEMVLRNREARRLAFTGDPQAAIESGDVIFIAVGTPPLEDGSADLRHVLAVARTVGQHMRGFKVVVQKSTVPVGTAEQVARVVRTRLAARGCDALGFSVVSNPEFLKEGEAVGDFLQPDRIVLGVQDDAHGKRALALMRQLYLPLDREHRLLQVMDLRSAELTKYAANAMLATRISFMNELANLADELGADIELVRQGMGSDPRIGPSFLQAGTGYGGSCFPKDVEALCRTAQAHGRPLQVLASVKAANDAQKHVLLDKVFRRYGRDLRGRQFAVLGLAFKPGTDDMREAPSRTVIAALLRAGARVVAHDPVAQQAAARALAVDLGGEAELLGRMAYAVRPMEAMQDADGLLLVTEWPAYRSLEAAAMKKAMRAAVVFDGRNLFDLRVLARAGVVCLGVGRSNLAWLKEPKAAAAPAASAPARHTKGAGRYAAAEGPAALPAA